MPSALVSACLTSLHITRTYEACVASSPATTHAVNLRYYSGYALRWLCRSNQTHVFLLLVVSRQAPIPRCLWLDRRQVLRCMVSQKKRRMAGELLPASPHLLASIVFRADRRQLSQVNLDRAKHNLGCSRIASWTVRTKQRDPSTYLRDGGYLEVLRSAHRSPLPMRVTNKEHSFPTVFSHEITKGFGILDMVSNFCLTTEFLVEASVRDETLSIDSQDSGVRMDGLAQMIRFLTALPEHMTCQKEATTYGTVRPFLDCIPVLRRSLTPLALRCKTNRLPVLYG
jgi:hypothetical protein